MLRIRNGLPQCNVACFKYRCNTYSIKCSLIPGIVLENSNVSAILSGEISLKTACIYHNSPGTSSPRLRDPVTLTTRTKGFSLKGWGRVEDMINTEQIPCPVSQNPVVAHQSINNGTSPVFIWQVLLLSSVLKLSGANFWGRDQQAL
ncbi:hypothetical protein CDAR_399911 [Caerostris darwini]|uniref:Uncharacterized protein n=1 Tax=Caerostris darwini TaxID=1538125 RepID=A0AAV4SAE0_9ARAC|nr:hypothetical protein CDAR_399911 [Caerostris darwini]